MKITYGRNRSLKGMDLGIPGKDYTVHSLKIANYLFDVSGVDPYYYLDYFAYVRFDQVYHLTYGV